MRPLDSPSRTRICLAGAVYFFLLAGQDREAAAQSVTQIVDNGSAENRVDIAILGEGYTAAELGKYAGDVQQLLQVFAQEPYSEYQRYFNVRRIDVVSAESGADHPELQPPVFRNTALDATYDCAGVPRLICIDDLQAESILASVLGPSQRDMVLVLVNDAAYGGSGGPITVVSTHPSVLELALHELGHSFALLTDEYGGSPTCDTSVEPAEPNATRESERSSIKWNHWIAASTPLPTNSTTPGVPGLYEGADYCDTGFFRPTYDSKMRSLGRPFEQINTERLVLRIHNLVSPLDGSAPAGTDLILSPGQVQDFSVSPLSPMTHALNVAWYVDAQLQGGGPSFSLDSGSLTDGQHTVEAVVTDPTTMVRSDPARLLVDRHAWSVTILGPGEFLDVSATHPFYEAIKSIALRGVTSGCGGHKYCPDGLVTRGQMAAFIMRALGEFDPPPPATQRFLDVPPSNPFYAYIGRLAERQITAGCGGGNYCPSAGVSRDQMAAFIIRALHSPGYVPPAPPTRRFLDVPPTHPFYAYIDEMAVRGITTGCGGANYCPSAIVTRGQMAAFLQRAFGF